MASLTLTQLRARVRELADMVSSQLVTDAADSLDAFINQAADELYRLVMQKYDSEYFSKYSNPTFNTVKDTESYALPADHFKLHGVELKVNGEWKTLRKYNQKHRNALRNMATDGWEELRYRLAGSNILILPAPSSVYEGRFLYTPTRTVLANGADALGEYNGWEEFVIVRAAIKCRLKEESDTTELERDLARITKSIEAEAEGRDTGDPETLTDVTRRNVDRFGNFTEGWEP